jgi:CubicO group peptidase (beta-lactamase class C family)
MNLKEIFESAIAPKDVPGSALILLHKDKNLIHPVGTSDKEDPNALIHQGTVFQIGSITKVFTALLAAGLVVKNALQLKGTVGDILSGERMDNSISGITILQLLTHTSGLPRLPDNFIKYYSRKEDPYADYGENELLEYLGDAKVQVGCKATTYSNLGYGLLGYLLGKVARMSYAQLLRERLCVPLGLPDTGVYAGPSGGAAVPAAKGYTDAGEETPFWNMNILSGAGGILSTPQDILSFLKAIVLGNSILEESIRKSLESLDKSMAWGWFKKDGILQLLNGTDVLWHNGMTGGFASYIEVSRQERRGLAVLFNKATYADFVGSAMQGKY